MPFRDILQGLVEKVEGGQGAVIMGYDGIPIDEYIKEDVTLDVQLLSVEYATLLKEIKRTVEVLENRGNGRNINNYWSFESHSPADQRRILRCLRS